MADKYSFQTSFQAKDFQEALVNDSGSKNIQESDDSSGSITRQIEAIHALITANSTEYTAYELQKATNSWTAPYDKPVLTHHKSRSGEPIGRVKSAEFTENTQADKPGHILEVEISDEEAVKKVEDGRYSTVSVGGHADHAICSICETDWVDDGWCSHIPGREYDEGVARLILRDIDFKEVSFVNVPADQYAQIISEKTSSYKDFKKENESASFSENKKDHNSNNKGGNFMADESKQELLEEKLETKAERVEVLEEKVGNLESKLEESNDRTATLEEKIKTLKDEKELMEEELDEVVEENEELREKQHKILAEKVVDKKVEMGKVKEDDREDKIEEYSARTEDSLKDTMKDLKEEQEAIEEENEETSEIGEELDDEGLKQEEENVEEDNGEEDNIDNEFVNRFA